jgi:hypothetical protein
MIYCDGYDNYISAASIGRQIAVLPNSSVQRAPAYPVFFAYLVMVIPIKIPLYCRIPLLFTCKQGKIDSGAAE